MPKVMLSGRIEEDLLRWVTGYAIERGVSRTAVLEWALREGRALARAGVPDLLEPGSADGRSASVGRVRRAGSRASSSPGAPAAPPPPARAPTASAETAAAPADAAETVAEMRADVERQGRETVAGLADVVTGTGPRSTVRAVPEAVRARQERLNRAKGLR
jgi:hypothetical protein